MAHFKLILFDIDGTITRHVSSWRYIHERLNVWDAIACRYQKQFLAGRISYRQFCSLDAAHWKGIPEGRIRSIFRGIRYSKNALASIRRLKRLGFKIAAISTGLQFMADKVRRDAGVDYVLSNRLIVRNGHLTGGVRIYIPHGMKGRIARRIIRHFGVTKGEVIAVGDTEGDIPLARAAGYSIAFNASSRKLTRCVDYTCRTNDFKEVFDEIIRIDRARRRR